LFNLTSQLRRAAAFVFSNIAEGSGENSKKEFQRFLALAIRSCYEIVSLLHLARRRKYLNKARFQNLYQEVEELTKQIFSFRKSLNSQP